MLQAAANGSYAPDLAPNSPTLELANLGPDPQIALVYRSIAASSEVLTLLPFFPIALSCASNASDGGN